MILLLFLLVWVLVGPRKKKRGSTSKWSGKPESSFPMTKFENGALPPRTDWLLCSTPPVREGWYEAMYDGEKSKRVEKRWYNLRYRQWQMDDDKEAGSCLFGLFDDDKWRGLTRPVK